MDFKSCLTKTNISFTLLVLFLIFMLVKMTDIALLLFCSYVISCAINPLVDKMSEKIPRAIATTVVISIITLITLGILIPIVVMSVNEIKDFVTQLPTQIKNLESFLNTFKIGSYSIGEFFNLDAGLTTSTEVATKVIDKSINFTVSLLGSLAILVTVAIIVFFITNDKKQIKEFSLKLFPISLRANASRIIDELEVKVGGYVTAQILSISIVGIIVAISLSVLHVDYAIFLGFISAVADLIPIVGPIISGALILIVAFPNGWLIAALAVGALLLGQFVENNWAKPYFFSKYMDLHPLIVIFSFVIAAKCLGVIGVMIAPAIAAVIVTLFDEIYVKTMNNESNN